MGVVPVKRNQPLVDFFSHAYKSEVEETLNRQQYTDKVLSSPTKAARVFCSYCGRRVAADVFECPGCGAPS